MIQVQVLLVKSIPTINYTLIQRITSHDAFHRTQQHKSWKYKVTVCCRSWSGADIRSAFQRFGQNLWASHLINHISEYTLKHQRQHAIYSNNQWQPVQSTIPVHPSFKQHTLPSSCTVSTVNQEKYPPVTQLIILYLSFHFIMKNKE